MTLNAVWRLLGRLAIIAAVVYLGYYLRTIINTLLIGAIIAYVFEPIVEKMIRWRLFQRTHTVMGRAWQTFWMRLSDAVAGLFGRRKNGASLLRKRTSNHVLRLCATSYALILFFIALWQGTVLVVQPFKQQVEDILAHKEEYIQKYRQKVPKEWQQRIEEKVQDPEFQNQLQTELVPVALKGASSLRYVVEIVLLPVLAFYFILDGRKLKREFIALAPRRHYREAVRMVREFNHIMRSYVLGQFILCLLAGVIIGLVLWKLNVRYAFVMAVLAGVTRAIPIVGPILGGIPIIALTYLDDPVYGYQKALAVLIFFTIMHFAESKFIMPLLIGERMELHAVVIIVVLLMGGELGSLILGGILGALLGMFFAPPVAAIIRVMIRRYALHLSTHPAHAPGKRRATAIPRGSPTGIPETID